MMKFLHKTTLLLACAAVLAACVKEQVPAGETGLWLRPAVSGLATKADPPLAEADRDENNLGSRLDVFIKGVTDPAFWREYHLDNCTFTSQDGELLSGNWMDDGFKPTDRYDVYVLVNGPDAAHRHVGSYAALLYLTKTDDDIYKVKEDTAKDYPKADAGDKDFYVQDKSLMMDGAFKDWSPVASQSKQTISMGGATALNRAAAKIEVNISFDGTFRDNLLAANEKPGHAMFKYERFAFSSAAFSFGEAVRPDIRSGEALKYANGNTVDHGSKTYSYQITTYSYARTWQQADAALDAPCVLVSIPFVNESQAPPVTTFHYYRIPVCGPGVHALERNHLYRVNATINSNGSWKEADAPVPVNLSYQILEWTPEAAMGVNQDAIDYFQISPTQQALWGDGSRTATLQYHAPPGAVISIGGIPSGDLAAANATEPAFTDTQTYGSYTYQAFYIDKNGDPKASDISGLTVDTDKQTITVTSEALANRASKFIRFRVSCGSHHEDIYLRHFPADNIQNIPGWYGYKLFANERRASPRREFSMTDSEHPDGYEAMFSLCPDQATYVGADDQYKYDEPTVTQDRRIQPAYGTYSWKEDTGVTQDEFEAALLSADERAAADSPDHAIQGCSGSYAYSYYYQSGGSFYKITYQCGYAKKRYSIATGHKMARWGYDHFSGYTGASTKWFHDGATTFDNLADKLYYEPYYYDETDGKIYNYRQDVRSSRYYLEKNDEQSWTNNRMYVIQLSEANNSYTLGRPILGPDSQSQDNTVSPAFMLASDLGTTGPATDEKKSRQTPAVHCVLYAEVGLDGIVYAGWRLPTQAEIALVEDYQSRAGALVIKDNILTGQKYSTLDGGFVTRAGSFSPDQQNEYIRCVRDLRPEEVAKLNHIK
ncbi:MAG: hypothetical protein IJV37_04495 [Bacteroidales bacterium]|nr:hypothetical protein [Bacteroidales bacterium]